MEPTFFRIVDKYRPHPDTIHSTDDKSANYHGPKVDHQIIEGRVNISFVDYHPLNVDGHIDIHFASVNVGDSENLTTLFIEDFGGFSIPMIVSMKDGKEVGRYKGHDADDIYSFVSSLVTNSTSQ